MISLVSDSPKALAPPTPLLRILGRCACQTYRQKWPVPSPIRHPACANLKKPVRKSYPTSIAMSDSPHFSSNDQHNTHDHAHEPITAPPLDDAAHLGEVKNNDIVAKAATIAVVGVAAAIVSVELIPGMILGVAAAFI